MNRTGLIAALALLTLAGVCGAAIINIPDDYQTIQAGIDSSENGDTVLVAPGEYREVDFNYHGVTLASLALTTGDDAYIDSTIINADRNGVAVRIPDAGGVNAVIYGFTVTGGDNLFGYGAGLIIADSGTVAKKLLFYDNNAGSGGGVAIYGMGATLTDATFYLNSARNSGGAVYVNGRNVVLDRLTIRDNSASYGGGICQSGQGVLRITNSAIASNNSSTLGAGIVVFGGGVIMDSVLVMDNESQLDAAGLYFIPANVPYTLTHCQITGNRAASYGSALYLVHAAVTLDNVTISNNRTDAESAIYSFIDGGVTARNSIVWNNGDLFGGNFSRLDFAYCDLEGGEEAVNDASADQREWGEGNMDADPEFVDEVNADYHLADDSPCIDAGDPGSHDPDGTRLDIGVWHYPQTPACLQGYILDFGDSSPLIGATVLSSLGQSAASNEEGSWRFFPAWIGMQRLFVSLAGYNSITSDEFEVVSGDTINLDFALHHPEIELSAESVSRSIPPDDTLLIDLSLSNDGNGELQWSVARRLAGGEYHIWDLRRSLNVGVTLEDYLLQGAAFVHGRFYVSGAAGDTNFVYILDREGRLIDQFPQTGGDRIGLRDLAWDGERLWGVADNTAYAYSLDGNLILEWTDRDIQNAGITWDGERALLWTAVSSDDRIRGFDEQGTLIESLAGVRYTAGLAYWPEDPDGFPLYLYCNTGVNDERQLIYKVDPARDSIRYVTGLPPNCGAPAGAEATLELDRGNWELLTLVNDGRHDRLDVWHLGSHLSWLSLLPEEGVLAPDNEEALTLTLNSAGMDTGIWNGELVFTHNAAGGELVLPVTLDVTTNGIGGGSVNLPAEFGISAIYPNPFNTVAVTRYELRGASKMNLSLYDISGRLVQTIDQGWQGAGEHRATINGEWLSSGVYLLKLAAGNGMAVRKVVCVK
jgi:hypothetical protein